MTKNLRKRYFKKIIICLTVFALTKTSTDRVYAHDFFANATNIATNGIVKCYPNPANTYIVFELGGQPQSEKYKLIIYSFTGRKMQDFSITSNRLRVDLGTYFRGVYLYQLVDRAGKVLESGKFQVVK